LLEIPKLFNLYIEEFHENNTSSKSESKNKEKSKMINRVNEDSEDVEMGNCEDVEMGNCEEEYMGESKEKDNKYHTMVDEEEDEDNQDDPDSSIEVINAIDYTRGQAKSDAVMPGAVVPGTDKWRITFPPLVLDNLANAFDSPFANEGDIRLFWAAVYRATRRIIKLDELAEEMARNAMLLRFGELCHANHNLTFAQVFPFYKVHFNFNNTNHLNSR
jgi:hypothetical protein